MASSPSSSGASKPTRRRAVRSALEPVQSGSRRAAALITADMCFLTMAAIVLARSSTPVRRNERGDQRAVGRAVASWRAGLPSADRPSRRFRGSTTSSSHNGNLGPTLEAVFKDASGQAIQPCTEALPRAIGTRVGKFLRFSPYAKVGSGSARCAFGRTRAGLPLPATSTARPIQVPGAGGRR